MARKTHVALPLVEQAQDLVTILQAKVATILRINAAVRREPADTQRLAQAEAVVHKCIDGLQGHLGAIKAELECDRKEP